MKNKILFFLLLCSLKGFSQIHFEKGNFVNNGGKKIDCLIENLDWRINPATITYKITQDSPEYVLNVNEVQEFNINNEVKYIRATVEIDKSSDKISNYSNVREPEFVTVTCFLKVLIEGKANLYQYVDNDKKRFFYATNQSEIKQLIFKNYAEDFNRIGVNNKYLQQLYNEFKCESITNNEIQKIKYNSSDLIYFFKKYNVCQGESYVDTEQHKHKKMVRFSGIVQLNRTSLDINRDYYGKKIGVYENKMSLGFGVDTELIMPFNKNKWSVFIQPTFNSYQSNGTFSGEKTSIDYNYIQIPLGVRYYMFLSDKSKMFLNAGFNAISNQKAKIEFETYDDLDLKTGPNLFLGMGFHFQNKFSAEVRFYSNRNILNYYANWDSNFANFSFVLGYTFF